MPALRMMVVWTIVLPSLALGWWDHAQATAAADDATTWTLRYQFPQSEFLYYDVEEKKQITTADGEYRESAYNESRSISHFRVIDQTETGTSLELSVDHTRMSARFDDGHINVFDSSDETTHAGPYQYVAKTVGRPLSIAVISLRGELISADSLIKDGAIAIDPSINFFSVLPAEPVAIGATWKESYTVQIDQQGLKHPVKMQRQFTLESVTGDLATISFRTVPLTPLRDPQIEASVAQQLFKGTIVFDVARGRMMSRESELNQTVIGAVGQTSSMSVAGRRTEKLTTPAALAAKPPETVNE